MVGSAAASTALHTGQRTTSGRLGHTWDGRTVLTPITAIARNEDIATGVVTSVQFAHATPAGAVARPNSRNASADIAHQLLDGRLDVMMGAGHLLFDKDDRAVAPDDVPAGASAKPPQQGRHRLEMIM